MTKNESSLRLENYEIWLNVRSSKKSDQKIQNDELKFPIVYQKPSWRMFYDVENHAIPEMLM